MDITFWYKVSSEINYDFQTGLIVYSETTNGTETNTTSLVSWRDDDVARYANLTPIIAGTVAGGVGLIVIVILLRKRKKTKY